MAEKPLPFVLPKKRVWPYHFELIFGHTTEHFNGSALIDHDWQGWPPTGNPDQIIGQRTHPTVTYNTEMFYPNFVRHETGTTTRPTDGSTVASVPTPTPDEPELMRLQLPVLWHFGTWDWRYQTPSGTKYAREPVNYWGKP